MRRWQDFTGKLAILEGAGRTFDEMVAGRKPKVERRKAKTAEIAA